MANLVEELEQLQAVGDLFLVLGHNLDGNTLLKVDGELVGLVGGVYRVDCAAGKPIRQQCRPKDSDQSSDLRPELLRGCVIGILENTSLVRAVNEVVCLEVRTDFERFLET